METNLVIIGFAEKNYSAYLPDLPGCISVGDSLEEVKNNIKEAVELHVEGSLADGDPIPDSFKANFELEFQLTVSAYLNELNKVIPYAGIERLTGINRKQVQHYASGLKQPRPAQVKKIEDALHNLGKQLLEVQL